MKKEHKHCLRRIIAASLVMLMASGTVPYQPITQVFNSAITASAQVAVTCEPAEGGYVTQEDYDDGDWRLSAYANPGYVFDHFTQGSNNFGNNWIINESLGPVTAYFREITLVGNYYKVGDNIVLPVDSWIDLGDSGGIYKGQAGTYPVSNIQFAYGAVWKIDCNIYIPSELSNYNFFFGHRPDGTKVAATDNVIGIKCTGGDGKTKGTPYVFEPVFSVTGVTLDKTTAQTVTVGDKVAFTASIAPVCATDKKVKWSVSSSNVKLYSDSSCTTEVGTGATDTLTVYAKGISAGDATVTVTSNADSTKTASCNVTVNKLDLTAGTDYTAPTANYADGETFITYDENEHALVNAGTVAEGKGTMMYGRMGDTDIVWSENVPTATDCGTYGVYYYVKGSANYNDTTPTLVTSKIDYAKTTLTLGATLGDAVVAEKGTTTAIEGSEGVYTLTGTKTYNVYTDKSISDSDSADALELTKRNTNKTFGDKTYNYRYEITVPVTPDANGYNLSHTNHYVGKVNSLAEDKYFMDVIEDGVTVDHVVTLDAGDVLYYGDKLDKDKLITIRDGYGSIVKVGDVIITETDANGGAIVALDKLTIGKKYVIKADVTTDASGSFDDDDKEGNIVTLKQEIEFKARPMSMNNYYLTTDNGDVSLPVKYAKAAEKLDTSDVKDTSDDTYTVPVVIVPDDTFTYNKAAQKPAIVVKNGADETKELVLKAAGTAGSSLADCIDSSEAQTNAGAFTYTLTARDGSSYTDSVTVAWSIQKADAVVTAQANDNIVYDGEKLNKNDFTITDNESVLTSKDAKLTIEASTGDLTSAGNHQAKITITSANYNDITLPVDVTIAKREVKVTPTAGQSMTYGTEAAPTIKVKTEKAVDEDDDNEWDTVTGVVAKDSDLYFSQTVEIADFDYTYYINDAGTYAYTLSDAVMDNYTPVLDGAAVFTIKPRKLTAAMFEVEDVDYTFDGEWKNAPTWYINSGKFTNTGTDKLTEADVEVGGTAKAVLPGNYTLEFSGQGNYYGLVSFDWEISPIKEYAVSVSVDNKTYDGTPVAASSFVYKTDDAGKTPVNIKGLKTTYKYYEYDGTSAINADYVNTLTALDGAPKNAGNYIVEASATAKGYSFEKVYSTFTIDQKEIVIAPNYNGKVFGEADPDFTNYSYNEDAVADGDALVFTGEYALPDDYEGNVGTYNFALGTLAFDADKSIGSDNYSLTIGGTYVVEPQELTDVNVKVFKDCTIGDDGWAYPGDSVMAVGTILGEEVELVRPVYDENTDTYTNTDYEFISATRTKKTGDVTVKGFLAFQNVESNLADNIQIFSRIIGSCTTLIFSESHI